MTFSHCFDVTSCAGQATPKSAGVPPVVHVPHTEENTEVEAASGVQLAPISGKFLF